MDILIADSWSIAKHGRRRSPPAASCSGPVAFNARRRLHQLDDLDQEHLDEVRAFIVKS